MGEECPSAEADVEVAYRETEAERRLAIDTDSNRVIIAQNRDGYAMLAVRDETGTERERYYGFDMALEHACELLDIDPAAVSIPDSASDMGM